MRLPGYRGKDSSNVLTADDLRHQFYRDRITNPNYSGITCEQEFRGDVTFSYPDVSLTYVLRLTDDTNITKLDIPISSICCMILYTNSHMITFPSNWKKTNFTLDGTKGNILGLISGGTLQAITYWGVINA